MNLAIIPARGGSKRIPKKNIRDFLGKPIIAYSIEAALKSGLFSEVMVSTDDNEIAGVSLKYGAKVPFMRSEANSNDFAGLSEVVEEVLKCYSDNGEIFANICLILSTAPFITPERIKEAYDLMLTKKYDSVFPVARFSFPIQRSLKMHDGTVSMFYPENFSKRSQDLEPAYHDSGTFYWMKTEEFNKQKRFYAARSGAIVLPEAEVQDIDSEEDWKLAEMKYKFKNEA